MFGHHQQMTASSINKPAHSETPIEHRVFCLEFFMLVKKIRPLLRLRRGWEVVDRRYSDVPIAWWR